MATAKSTAVVAIFILVLGRRRPEHVPTLRTPRMAIGGRSEFPVKIEAVGVFRVVFGESAVVGGANTK